jgi:hypothetical protein
VHNIFNNTAKKYNTRGDPHQMAFHLFQTFHYTLPSDEIHVDTWRQQVQQILLKEKEEEKKYNENPPLDLKDVNISYVKKELFQKKI